MVQPPGDRQPGGSGVGTIEAASIGRTIALFAIAGLAEIAGGWLVWQWLRVDRPWPLGVVGALVLVSYGVIPTFQEEASFGRVYAAYGGVFVVLAMGWGWLVDGWRPDRWDMAGAALCLVGVTVIMFAPRNAGSI